MQNPSEPSHLGSLLFSHLFVPVMHDPTLPLAVRGVSGRERHVEESLLTLHAGSLEFPRHGDYWVRSGWIAGNCSGVRLHEGGEKVVCSEARYNGDEEEEERGELASAVSS